MSKSTPNTDLFARETRAILLCGMLFCSMTAFFIAQKEYFNFYERPLEEAFTKDSLLLLKWQREGTALVRDNPICQYNGHAQLDSAALRCIKVRMVADSIAPMYAHLTAKGWKIESAWWLQQRYLNDDLLQRMYTYLDDIKRMDWNKHMAHKRLMSYRSYRELVKAECIYWANICLLFLVLLIYPVRWCWYFWSSGYNVFSDVYNHINANKP